MWWRRRLLKRLEFDHKGARRKGTKGHEGMDYQLVVQEIERVIIPLLMNLSEREDSRAFGAMVQRLIENRWSDLCSTLGYSYQPKPGVRSIYDIACQVNGEFMGIDIKTKNLDSGKYSDGGVCSVDNLLDFIVNKGNAFLILEVGHRKSDDDPSVRVVGHVKVVPIHCLPKESYRIENLGSGQVRLNKDLKEVEGQIEWRRTLHDFLRMFCPIIISHYNTVQKKSKLRMQSIKDFEHGGFRTFTAVR